MQFLGWRDFRIEFLYRAHVSIEFGAYYLHGALEMLDENLIAALAGYNSGPGNAAQWLDSSGGDDDQLFLNIHLSEPRLYIEHILSYYATYQRLYGGIS